MDQKTDQKKDQKDQKKDQFDPKKIKWIKQKDQMDQKRDQMDQKKNNSEKSGSKKRSKNKSIGSKKRSTPKSCEPKRSIGLMFLGDYSIKKINWFDLVGPARRQPGRNQPDWATTRVVQPGRVPPSAAVSLSRINQAGISQMTPSQVKSN